MAAARAGASSLPASAERLYAGARRARGAPPRVAADHLSRLPIGPESKQGLAVEIQLLYLLLHGASPRGRGGLNAPPLNKVPARAEERCADAYVRGALLDCRLEVVAHAHRQPSRPARPFGPAAEVVPQLAQAPEP